MAPNPLFRGGQIKKLWGKGAEFRAQPGTPYSTNQHKRTNCHSGQIEKVVRKEAGLRAQGGTFCSISQHKITVMVVQSKRRRGLELSAEPSIPPVNIVPHGDQIKSVLGKEQSLEISAEPCFAPVNTVPHRGHIECL